MRHRRDRRRRQQPPALRPLRRERRTRRAAHRRAVDRARSGTRSQLHLPRARRLRRGDLRPYRRGSRDRRRPRRASHPRAQPVTSLPRRARPRRHAAGGRAGDGLLTTTPGAARGCAAARLRTRAHTSRAGQPGALADPSPPGPTGSIASSSSIQPEWFLPATARPLRQRSRPTADGARRRIGHRNIDGAAFGRVSTVRGPELVGFAYGPNVVDPATRGVQREDRHDDTSC